MTERIVIFGGTFDPIHHGHLIAARAVAEKFDFEKVTFMPTLVPPHKGDTCPIAPAGDRLEMVRLAVADSGIFDVSDIELRRAGPSYTIETLLSLRSRFGPQAELYWIIGADMLAELPTWCRAGDVVEAARIITAARPPHNREIVSEALESLRAHFTTEQVERISAAVIETSLIDISSTQIRRRLGEGKSVRYLTPDAVVDYIRERSLYAPGR